MLARASSAAINALARAFFSAECRAVDSWRNLPISKEPLPALPLPALPVKLPVSLIYVRPLQWLAPRVTMGASSISQIVTNRESPDRLQFSTEHEVRDEVSLSMA